VSAHFWMPTGLHGHVYGHATDHSCPWMIDMHPIFPASLVAIDGQAAKGQNTHYTRGALSLARPYVWKEQ